MEVGYHLFSNLFYFYIYRFNQPKLCYFDEILAKPMDKELSDFIRQHNVLIDDTTTSGSTLNEILCSLRKVNDDNNITIFSLVGRKGQIA